MLCTDGDCAGSITTAIVTGQADGVAVCGAGYVVFLGHFHAAAIISCSVAVPGGSVVFKGTAFMVAGKAALVAKHTAVNLFLEGTAAIALGFHIDGIALAADPVVFTVGVCFGNILARQLAGYKFIIISDKNNLNGLAFQGLAFSQG